MAQSELAFSGQQVEVRRAGRLQLGLAVDRQPAQSVQYEQHYFFIVLDTNLSEQFFPVHGCSWLHYRCKLGLNQASFYRQVCSDRSRPVTTSFKIANDQMVGFNTGSVETISNAKVHPCG